VTEGTFLVSKEDVGFALGRIVLDEAELLTLAVKPDAQRQGIGRACLSSFEKTAAEQGALRCHLEVAESNKAARALYGDEGWQETGLRKAYYRSENGRVDAILMMKRLAADEPGAIGGLSAHFTKDSY